ncbi:hypothetical protein, partial [Clostridium sp. MCC353]|uniref:hypothetical protein n=1 Tax=Clostridium sp. MCC353 TaxID=2592646 RepID=UPI001C01A16F
GFSKMASPFTVKGEAIFENPLALYFKKGQKKPRIHKIRGRFSLGLGFFKKVGRINSFVSTFLMMVLV